jgi:hypothetical protein
VPFALYRRTAGTYRTLPSWERRRRADAARRPSGPRHETARGAATRPGDTAPRPLPAVAADADDAEPCHDVLSGYRSDDRTPRGDRPFLIGLSRLSDELLRGSRNASPRQAPRSRPRPRLSPSPSLLSLSSPPTFLHNLSFITTHLHRPPRPTPTPLLCRKPGKQTDQSPVPSDMLDWRATRARGPVAGVVESPGAQWRRRPPSPRARRAGGRGRRPLPTFVNRSLRRLEGRRGDDLAHRSYTLPEDFEPRATRDT